MKNKILTLFILSNLTFLNLQTAGADSRTVTLTGKNAQLLSQSLASVSVERNAQFAAISLIQQYEGPGMGFSYYMTYADQADRTKVSRVAFPEEMKKDLEDLIDSLYLDGKGLHFEGNEPHYTQTIISAAVKCKIDPTAETSCLLKQD